MFGVKGSGPFMQTQRPPQRRLPFNRTRQIAGLYGGYIPGLGGGLSGMLGDSTDTGGTQMDTGGTQPTGTTANPVMEVVGTPMAVLPAATPTILSSGVSPVATTPQSPMITANANPLAVSDGGFIPPAFPAPAAPAGPNKALLYGGAALLIGGLLLFYHQKKHGG
jgi:hypothetical protein